MACKIYGIGFGTIPASEAATVEMSRVPFGNTSARDPPVNSTPSKHTNKSRLKLSSVAFSDPDPDPDLFGRTGSGSGSEACV
jgi:hypothetical protein